MDNRRPERTAHRSSGLSIFRREMMMKGAKVMACDNDDWQVEDDLRTLCKAKEIQADPKRMKKCQELATVKMKEMGSVAGSAASKD
jgi:hypothetical protein